MFLLSACHTFMKQGSKPGFCVITSSFSLFLRACTAIQVSGACRLLTRAFTSLVRVLDR